VRILTTLLAPDEGRATIADCEVVRDAERVRSLIGLAGQYAAVDELLTGRENLELVGRLYHLDKAERRRRAQEVLERFALTDAGDRVVKTYSGGMRRRLDLGASLIGRTPVLILDEPTTGLDPVGRKSLGMRRNRVRPPLVNTSTAEGMRQRRVAASHRWQRRPTRLGGRDRLSTAEPSRTLGPHDDHRLTSLFGSSATRLSSSSRLPLSRSRSPGGRGGSASADRSRWWMSASTAKNMWSRPA